MKRFALAAFALAASAFSASAADLAVRPYTKAPPPLVAAYDWSGFYLGANGGGAWSRKCWDVDPYTVPLAGNPFLITGPEGCHTAGGATAGGQIGYRWQQAAWVFGLEAQGNWAGLTGSNPSQVAVFAGTANRSRIDAIGLFTGQVGYSWSSFLLYAKGGAAVARDRYDSFLMAPLCEPGHESFTNYDSVPIRHGMTIGELAKMFNSERSINARLQVVPLQGWMRGDWYDSTGLAWVNPSPNLRSLTEATLYPGVALVEGTNVSVGRGTDTPFELLGAPWINGRELAQYLNARNISGVRFLPVSFTPSASTHAGQKCQGINIILIERNAFDAPELGMELASALRKLYPEQFQMERMIELLANQSVYDAIAKGENPQRIAEDWREPLETFQQLRQKYLIYK